MAKRKGFNFYASYYLVLETLNDKEKLQYLMALIEREFDGKHPNFLNMLPMAKFAYISQQHSIDAQVVGFEQKTKELLTPIGVSTQGGYKGGSVQEKGEEEEKVQYVMSVFTFEEFWNMYPNKVAKSKCEAKYKNISEKEREQIKLTLSKFIRYKPFDSYRHPNPETYLNQKRWQDVLPENVIKVEPVKQKVIIW